MILYEKSKKAGLKKTENRKVVTRDWRDGGELIGELFFKGINPQLVDK